MGNAEGFLAAYDDDFAIEDPSPEKTYLKLQSEMTTDHAEELKPKVKQIHEPKQSFDTN